jgi:hypothetical protein
MIDEAMTLPRLPVRYVALYKVAPFTVSAAEMQIEIAEAVLRIPEEHREKATVSFGYDRDTNYVRAALVVAYEAD